MEATKKRTFMTAFRIKPGVKPYGGKRVEIIDRLTYRNGREWVEVSLGTKKLSIAHHGPDIRLYRADEIEEIKEKH